MFPLTTVEAIDYLIIGHLTHDILPGGERIGGTVAYAALAASALGLRVGVVTSWAGDFPLGPLSHLPIANFQVETSTTMELRENHNGREIRVSHVAPKLEYFHVPEAWRRARIVHLAPVAQEVEPSLVRNFSDALVGVTPQGWLRTWDDDGLVYLGEWPESPFVLHRAGAAVVSVEDVAGDENRIDELAAQCRVLAVTEGDQGARIYWNGDVRRIRSPKVDVVDATGAGDIFAAAFFTRLYATRDPWEAGRFATQIASISVSRPGFDGIPRPEEIRDCLQEVY